MGKFARVAAHVKNVTADPVQVGVKHLVHGVAVTGRFVKHQTHTTLEAVREEEKAIEVRKALKAEAQAFEDNLIAQALTNEDKPRKASSKSSSKATKPKTATA